MDGTIKQSRRFAELERLSDDYFRYHLASVMDETRDYLARKQGEEMKEYSTSLGGVLSMMASSAQPLNDPYQLLKVTGEWNSKTTEDYVEMCKEKIAASEDIQHDLAYMAGQWRDAVVKEIGRERYDELSEQLGGDLAYAYMDYRLEQQMIDKLVKDRMPKSSADYIIRKAAESSLFGLPQMLSRSPLAEEIEKRGEAASGRAKLSRVRDGCWVPRRIPSCWAVPAHGRHSPDSSVWMLPFPPPWHIWSRKTPSRFQSNNVSARVYSAANTMCLKISGVKQPP